jgi:DNA polymerase
MADRSGQAVLDAAFGAASLDALADRCRGCLACSQLAASRSRVVPGQFPAGARVLLVGEAPGAAEDEAGQPFVGRAGQLLDRLLAEAGLDRRTVAVTNVVKCRPPGNRTPRRAEARRCAGWLDRQVRLADPELIVTLGRTAAAWAFGPGARLGDLRGAARPCALGGEPDGRAVVATYHPSAALRFGPRGTPRAALADDLALVARLLAASPRDRRHRC